MTERHYFEHPLNEPTRILLRLEYLFNQLDFFRAQDSVWATRAAIESLLAILAITNRIDIRENLLNELTKHLQLLRRIQNRPDINVTKLEETIKQVQRIITTLSQIDGLIAATTREDHFLKNVAQRNAIPGGLCSFDVPHYHFLLTRPLIERQQLLALWSSELTVVGEAVRLLLTLIRNNIRERHVEAPQGLFQETLDISIPIQMIQIGLTAEQPYFPEVSGYNNRFSIRFFYANFLQQPLQSHDDISFHLICCLF
jgi:cell division protein ZapD